MRRLVVLCAGVLSAVSAAAAPSAPVSTAAPESSYHLALMDQTTSGDRVGAVTVVADATLGPAVPLHLKALRQTGYLPSVCAVSPTDPSGCDRAASDRLLATSFPVTESGADVTLTPTPTAENPNRMIVTGRLYPVGGGAAPVVLNATVDVPAARPVRLDLGAYSRTSHLLLTIDRRDRPAPAI